MFKLIRCLSYLLLLFCISSTQATTYYNTQASYLSALGAASTTTYNFDALTAGDTIASGDTLNGATFSYDLGGYSIMVDNSYDTTSPSNSLGTNDASGAFFSGDQFTITFDQTMYAAGLYVISNAELFDDDLTLSTSSGQSVGNGDGNADLDSNYTLLNDGGLAYYIALIEDDPNLGFNSITLSSADFNFLFNVDDITVAAVPLPAAAWLFGSGLLFLAGYSRQSRKS